MTQQKKKKTNKKKNFLRARSWPLVDKWGVHGDRILLFNALHPSNEYVVCLSQKHNKDILISYGGALLI